MELRTPEQVALHARRMLSDAAESVVSGALSLDVPSLIVLPIDYSLDVAISDELGEETVIRT